jgi:hypothetical protein
MWRKNDTPSQEFIHAIIDGFQSELQDGEVPTCARIWNQIVMKQINSGSRIDSLFLWDSSTGRHNRIRTIAECIECGYVPRLRLTKRDGREVVESY